MLNMLKPLFVASVLSGGGLFAYAVNVEQGEHALAGASLEPSPAAVRVVPPPTRISEPAPLTIETAALDVPPVTVVASLRSRRTVHAAVVQKTAAEAKTPCSGWRDLGPQHVMSGSPSGMHQVRSLCE